MNISVGLNISKIRPSHISPFRDNKYKNKLKKTSFIFYLIIQVFSIALSLSNHYLPLFSICVLDNFSNVDGTGIFQKGIIDAIYSIRKSCKRPEINSIFNALVKDNATNIDIHSV